MSPRRLPGLLGLAGILAFLPFGIAGQQISGALAALGVLLNRGSRERVASLVRPGEAGKFLGIAIAVWIGASLLSLLLSGQAAEGVRELRKILLLLGLFLPAGVLASRREFRLALLLLLLAGSAASLLGILEQMHGGGDHPTRLDGPIGFYMTMSGILLPMSLLSLALLVHREWLRGIVPAAFVVLTGALVLTYTRGAWFGWVAGAALLLLRRRPALLLPLLAGCAAVLLLHPAVRDRFLTSFDPEYAFNRERLFLWKAGLRAFVDHPIHGAGLHDLRGLIERYRDPEARETLTHFHNIYLQTAVAMGTVGLIALFALFTAFFRVLLRAAGRARQRMERGVAEGALAALAAFLVHGFFEWNLGDSEVAATLYTVIGLGIAGGRRHTTDRPPEDSFRSKESRAFSQP